jgi:hypothetical protein
VRRRRVRQAEFPALEPNGFDRPADLPGDHSIGQLAQQSDLFLGPGIFADRGAEILLLVDVDGKPTRGIALGLGEFTRLNRRAALFRRGTNQAIRPVIVHLHDLKRSPPTPDNPDADSPPVTNIRGALVLDGAEQFIIDEQAGSAALVLDGQAARPGDWRIGPGCNDHVKLAVKAHGEIAFVQDWRTIRYVEEGNAVVRVHGVEGNELPTFSPPISSRWQYHACVRGFR